jgi:hypothetical protein
MSLKCDQALLTANEGRDSQLLLPVADLNAQWKRKGTEELHSSVNTPRGQRRKLLEGHYRKGSSPWFRRAFVSVNRMTAGHTSLKASLNRFNILFKAEFKRRNISSGTVNCTRTKGQH